MFGSSLLAERLTDLAQPRQVSLMSVGQSLTPGNLKVSFVSTTVLNKLFTYNAAVKKEVFIPDSVQL